MRYSNHIVDETTHAFKCAKWFALVSSLLLGIFGTVLLIWPNTSMNVICTLLGVLMVVFGDQQNMSATSFNVSYHIGFQFESCTSDFSPCMFGILFLTHPGAILSITWVLVGIYEIVESVFKPDRDGCPPLSALRLGTAFILRHRLFAVWYFPDLQPCKGRQPVRSGHGHFADLRWN